VSGRIAQNEVVFVLCKRSWDEADRRAKAVMFKSRVVFCSAG